MRRTLLAAPALLLLRPAAAQDTWPSRTVRIVIPFAAGGSSDLAARLLAPRVGAILGQQVVIENRGGGGGNIAAEGVARATDGHTLFQGNMGVLAVNPTLYRQLPFEVERDFQPVSHIMAVANILVTPADRPYRSVADLVAALRAAPERVRAGNSGPGSIGHLAVVLLDSLAGTRSVHVPYRGGGPMATDLIGGHLDYAFATTPTVLGAIQAGRVRALAVATGTRSPLLPDVPTVAEAGVTGFDVNNWDSWLFPRGVPAAQVNRMADAVRQALAEPELRAEFSRRGLEPMASSPTELAAAIRAETARWAPIVRASGATPEG